MAVALVGAQVLPVIFGMQAIAASNTVPGSRAGEGTGSVSGYIVDEIDYELAPDDPTEVETVAFELDQAPTAGSTIKVRLAPAGSWFDCAGGPSVQCATDGQALAEITEVRVVVAD